MADKIYHELALVNISASSSISHKTHIAPAMANRLVLLFLGIPQGMHNVLSSGSVYQLCTRGALRYTSLQLSLFYGILCLHVSFPGSWELLEGTEFSTIQVFNKCLSRID